MAGSVIEYRGKRGTVWRIKFTDADGRQVMETLGREADGWTEKKAREALEDRRSDVRRKGLRKPEQLSFGKYKQTWFERGQAKRNWKPKTLACYRCVLNRLAFFDAFPLAAIRPRHVAEYVDDALARGYNAKTIELDLSVLHDIFLTARVKELVEHNPAEGVERPKVKRTPWRIFTPAEFSAVLRAFVDERARLVFMTLHLTGLRRFELMNLRWRDIDLLEGVLRVVESKSEQGRRSIALPSPLLAALAAHYQRTPFKSEEDFVFAHPRLGSRLEHHWYAGEFRAALKAAGITDYVRPFHDARHSSLTNGAANGEGELKLMTRAGHSSMSTTKEYLHLAGTVFREEAESLADRMLGSVESSTDLSEPDSTLAHLEAGYEAE